MKIVISFILCLLFNVALYAQELSIVLTSNSKPLKVYNHVRFDVNIKNTTNKPIQLFACNNLSGIVGVENGGDLLVNGEKKDLIKWRAEDSKSPFYENNFITLQPNDHYPVKRINVLLEEAGEYTINYFFNQNPEKFNSDRAGNEKTKAKGSAITKLELSGSFSFTISPSEEDTSTSLAWTIPNVYDVPLFFIDGTSVAVKGGKVGLIDKTNQVVIPFQYDDVSIAFHDRIKVKENNKFGVLDNKGQVVIPIVYDEIAHNLVFNKFILKEKNKYVILSKEGELLTTKKYDNISLVPQDRTMRYYTCTSNGKKGILDLESNQEILPIEYTSIIMNARVNAQVNDPDPHKNRNDFAIVKKDSSCYSFNVKTKLLDDLSVYDSVRYSQAAGYFVVRKSNKFGVFKAGKGEVIPTKYTEIKSGDIDQPLFIVTEESKYGVVDSTHSVVIPLEYRSIYYYYPFKNEKKFFRVTKQGAGLAKSDGEIIIPPLYGGIDFSRDSTCQIAMIQPSDKRKPPVLKDLATGAFFSFAHLGLHARWYTDKYFVLGEIDTLYSKYYIKYIERSIGIMDRKENILIPFQYNKLLIEDVNRYPYCGNGYIYGITDSTYTKFDTTSFEILNQQSIDAYPVKSRGLQNFVHASNNSGCVESYDHYKLKPSEVGGEIGLADEEGNIVIPHEYEDLYYISDAYFSLQKNGKWGCVDVSKYLKKVEPDYVKVPLPYDYVKKVKHDFPEEDVNIVIRETLSRSFPLRSRRSFPIRYKKPESWDYLASSRQGLNSEIILANGNLDYLLYTHESNVIADSRDMIYRAQIITGRVMCEEFEVE